MKEEGGNTTYGGEGTDSEERRSGGGETEDPEHPDKHENPLTGQDRGISEGTNIKALQSL